MISAPISRSMAPPGAAKMIEEEFSKLEKGRPGITTAGKETAWPR